MIFYLKKKIEKTFYKHFYFLEEEKNSENSWHESNNYINNNCKFKKLCKFIGS